MDSKMDEAAHLFTDGIINSKELSHMMTEILNNTTGKPRRTSEQVCVK